MGTKKRSPKKKASASKAWLEDDVEEEFSFESLSLGSDDDFLPNPHTFDDKWYPDESGSYNHPCVAFVGSTTDLPHPEIADFDMHGVLFCRRATQYFTPYHFNHCFLDKGRK